MSSNNKQSKGTGTIAQQQKDFASKQEVRWCPGCGDYAVLSTIQRTLPKLGLNKENIAFISGIGCASRFPYYLNTYGFHTIHGRAPAIATGLKISRPELSVWVVTGDGDGLSIGLGHLLHLMRRNLDINILLFNNQVYGLTKGQYSPTSSRGAITGTSPQGVKEEPLNPVKMALAANCSFVARAIDIDAPHLGEILQFAAKHQGTSFIEILQNCPVYNDGVFDNCRAKATRADNVVYLKNNQPLKFGANLDKGLILNDNGELAVSSLERGQKIINHQTDKENSMINYLLAETADDLPIALGVFRQLQRPVFEKMINSEHSMTSDLSSLKKVLSGQKENWSY